MSALSKLFLLFTLALSVSSMATPHAARSLGGHHALAARKANPVPALPPYGAEHLKVVKPKRLRRRSNSSRCAAKSSSLVSSSVVATSSAVATSAPAVNAASDPTTSVSVHSSSSSSSSSIHSSSSSSTFSSSIHISTSIQIPATTEAASPTSTPAKTSSSSTKASSTQAASGSVQTGQGTFYDVGLGSCGVTNVASDFICAVSHDLYDTFPGYDGVNPNNNPVCGKSITATYQGKSVTVKVEDRCTGCAFNDLDFSRGAFDQLASESVGRLDGLTWVWNN